MPISIPACYVELSGYDDDSLIDKRRYGDGSSIGDAFSAAAKAWHPDEHLDGALHFTAVIRDCPIPGLNVAITGRFTDLDSARRSVLAMIEGGCSRFPLELNSKRE